MTILKESSDKTITVQLMDQLEIRKVVDPNFWLNINIRNCKNLVDRVNGAWTKTVRYRWKHVIGSFFIQEFYVIATTKT